MKPLGAELKIANAKTPAGRAMISKVWRDERARFLIVGGFNTLFGFVAYSLLYLVLGERIHYLALAVISHFISVAVAFAMYRRHVFNSNGAIFGEFIRYNIAVLGNLALGMAVLALLVAYAKLNPIVAQGIAVVLVVFANYFLHKYFTFRRQK